MSARHFQATLLVAAALLASGCAMQPKLESQTRTVGGVAPARVESVYVYSFLDVRERDLGREFMKQFERILSEELGKRGVRSKQLWYGTVPDDSLQARPLSATPATQRLPIEKIVAGNKDQEVAFKPTYRLMVTPSEMQRQGSWIKALVRFDLVDPATGRSLWTLRADTMHLPFANVDDNAEKRARDLVAGMIAEMQKAGLLAT